ncbi:Membrane-spanning 4-domains subfamily A member 6A [Galemys pyrenaicus]|uniref:Membrane-spanning 4-domains subfamily A member 6A n=1 Tax=Galemys pyrenaicus TaxID=202257 RepID=A0A8J6DD63_GALPY|nr:Membrane-spanning 4-domains subfamily A member 6A [Galemys pyrenaicus]
MVSQPTAHENFVVLSHAGIKFLQAETPKPNSQTQDGVEKHLKAEVKVLGTIQILCGAVILSLGIILASASPSPHFTKTFSTLLKAAYPFVGALCVSRCSGTQTGGFILSGSLSITTEKKATKTLVRGCLATNVLSCLAALVGLVLLSVNLAGLRTAFGTCTLEVDRPHEERRSYYYSDVPDLPDCMAGYAVLAGVLSMILICTVLEFLLAVLTTAIWWKQHRSDFPGVSVCP